MITKAELRAQFSADWKKHYNVKVLAENGYSRRHCKNCGCNFWSIDEREVCADASCMGYEFIGSPPSKKSLSYVDTWKEIEKYFVKNGHASIAPYPTVARWRDDLYFTVASINDFQPYVVNGEVEPPANPLLVPQTCIRFSDIGNVGVTGRHYTNFVMIGQHAFNTKKTGLFYWKDEALGHDIKYLGALGIPKSEIVFKEDVWMGGGNFGPCIEYFCRGLELGNCVFMQYAITDEGTRELSTKVIDMGAGLSRLAWITSGAPTSYEIVFGPVIEKMKKQAGISIEKALFEKYARVSGSLDVSEVKNISDERALVAGKVGVDAEELFSTIEPLHALYACADHLSTHLFTCTDGMLPSNSGGGYNIRMILRRVFGFDSEFDLRLDYAGIIEGHAKHLHGIFPYLTEGVRTAVDVVEEERRKYESTKAKGRAKVSALVSKAKTDGKRISPEQLKSLYESDGVPIELVEKIAKADGFAIDIPSDFYALIRKEDEAGKEKAEQLDLAGMEKTKGMYYEDTYEFAASVVGTKGKFIILDKSAFYPEGGGQYCDGGTLDGEPVLYVKKEAGVILHEVKDASKFKIGSKIKGIVDRGRRMQTSRHHSAVHLVNAACRHVLGNHIWQAGAYKDVQKAHIDVTHYRRITDEEVARIELAANEFVMSDMPIVLEVLPRIEAEQKYGFRLYQGGAVPGAMLRVISMGEIDHQACGGTHTVLKSTGQIGPIRITKREGVQDGVERLTLVAGEAAVKYTQEREGLLRDAADSLMVPETQLKNTARKFFEDWKAATKENEQLTEIVVVALAQKMADEARKAGKTIVGGEYPSYSPKFAEKLAVEISKQMPVCITAKDGFVAAAASSQSGMDALELLKQAGARGGGNKTFARGKKI
jgi:alanyl-tRNA synthetase